MSLAVKASRASFLGAVRLRIAGVVERALSSLSLRAIRAFAIVAGVLQLAAAFVAMQTKLMLHADGSFFAYAIGVDSAWALRWHEVPSRVTAYVLSVVPTELLARALDLGPAAISSVYGLLFYLVPALLFALACGLVWRVAPRLMLFPVAFFAFFTSLGYGFPSEILLAPGLMFLALFLAERGRAFSVAFFLSWLGLLFSHELAVPAAVVVAAIGVKSLKDAKSGRGKIGLLLAAVALSFIAYAYVRVAGGSSADSNAIYVLDPRRILNNPTLWLLVLSTGLVALASRGFDLGSRTAMVATAAVAGVGVWLVALVLPSLNFEVGRYDSARTMIGGGLFLFALLFAFCPTAEAAPPQTDERVWRGAIAASVAAALAITSLSSALFLADWVRSLDGVRQATSVAGDEARPELVDIERAGGLMSPEQMRATERVSYGWALPFRSAVLADGRMPARILHGSQRQIRFVCFDGRSHQGPASRIPVAASEVIQAFACEAGPIEPTESLRTRINAAVQSLRARIRGEKE